MPLVLEFSLSSISVLLSEVLANKPSVKATAIVTAVIAYIKLESRPLSLTELQEQLPEVVKIKSEQVKTYLEALVEKNRVRQEAIGGNMWYWITEEDAGERATKEKLRETCEKMAKYVLERQMIHGVRRSVGIKNQKNYGATNKLIRK